MGVSWDAAGGTAAAWTLGMAHADSDRPTLGQATVAFHQQPTVVVGPNDLAREIFRQCGSTTVKRAVSATQTATWPTAPSAPRGSMRGALVCIACLFLGIGAGHAFREGRAYAGELPALDGVSLARHEGTSGATEPRPRATRAAASIGAQRRSGARAKELSPSAAASPAVAIARPGRGTERRHGAARAPALRPAAPPISMEALFLDFEPAFRVAP
jgi:hypothetical protein